MENGKFTLAQLQIETEISYITILDMEINSNENDHGKLSLVLEVSEDITAADADRLQGTNISVNLPDGSCIFNGKCEDAVMQDENRYHTVYIYALTHSMDMDRSTMDRTFQNPAKTLEEVLGEVIEGYGAVLVLDQDVTITHVISQKGETDWEFIKRLSAEMGKNVYVEMASDLIRIGIGTEGLYQFDSVNLKRADVRRRDIDRLRYELANGNDEAAAWQFDGESAESDSLVVWAGSKSGNNFITSNRIYSDGGIIRNQIEAARPSGVIPAFRQTALESIYNTVLTGTVLAVNKNMIQVEFDAPGGQGGNTWITYESSISNSFYCMPDIGDAVFIYFEITVKSLV